MRLCICVSDLDRCPNGDTALLSQLQCKDQPAPDIILASYRYPKSGVGGNRYYLFHGYQNLKITFCRRFLRIIDRFGWIPSALARIPLRLCQRELLAALLAFDPDAIGILRLRWERQLRSLIQKGFPQWKLLPAPAEWESKTDSWRKYDPTAKVSIVLPTYNGNARYLVRSIDSCLNQTHRQIEVVIVDDGSQVNIPEILSHYQDTRLKYVRHEKNRGLPAALNKGFSNCTGQYLTWTSDDNYYSRDAIEIMLRFIQSYPELDFVCAESYEIGDEEEGPARKVLRTRPPEWLNVNNGIGACFLYKREVYEAVGQYDERVALAEDYDYWIRVFKKFRMQQLNRPLYYYRFHRDSLTGQYTPDRVRERVQLVKRMHRIRVGRTQ